MSQYLGRGVVLFLLLGMILLGIISCSNSTDDTTLGSIVGFAIRSGENDHSGITLKLYRVVAPDPEVASALNQYTIVGFALNQSCLFDHRDETEIRTTTTNSAGRFSFGDLGDGNYNVVADDSGLGYRYALDLVVRGNEVRTDSLFLFPIEQPPAEILQNTTWETGHHYKIVHDVSVAEGAQLTIEMGTFIRFAGPTGFTKINIMGTLNAHGEPNDFIRWVRDDIDLPWDQVNIESSGSAQNYITWNLFDGGTIGLRCNDSNLSLQSSLFRNCSSSGVSFDYVSNIQVENCIFLDCVDGTGISCFHVDDGIIVNNLFNNDYYAISCTQSSFPKIRRNWIANCYSGIFLQFVSPGVGDSLIIANNLIEQCYNGIHASGSSFGTIRYNIIRNCDADIIRIKPIAGGYSQPVINFNNLTDVGSGGYLMELSLQVNTHDVDATNNWWGTTDTYTIGNLIYDGNDEGNTATGVVLYTPFRLQPVPDAGIIW